jgi:tryptophan synthase alpha chain
MLVERVRAQTDLPVAVGIGVSTPEHARAAAEYADGVIVGSALIQRIADAAGLGSTTDASDPVSAADPAEAVRRFVAGLRAALNR